MRLILDDRYKSAVGWNWTLTRMLASSGLFELRTRQFDELHGLPPHPRAANLTLMELDGVLVALDTWDTFQPTSAYHRVGLFARGGRLGRVRLLLKVQHFPCAYWDRFTAQTGIRVSGWTVMPTRDFPLEHFRWEPRAHRYLATVTGRNGRFGRQPWVDFCRRDPRFYAKDYNEKDSLETYLGVLRSCRWGLVLKGKRRESDGKNRREAEFASCGMPLAMNYQPHYPFRMEAGKDFVLLERPEDLASLADIDPTPFAAASRRAWREGFSPEAIGRRLVALAAETGAADGSTGAAP